MTTYLEFVWPYCLFTMQLLWSYWDDLAPFIQGAAEKSSPLKFFAVFSATV